MTHVDVVKNEWLAGYQVVVARVCAPDGTLRVDASQPAWQAFVERYRSEARAGDDMTFVTTLHDTLAGDYVFATEAHDEADCPFRDMVVPLVVRREAASDTAQESPAAAETTGVRARRQP